MKKIKVKQWYIAKSDYHTLHERIGYMIMCKNKHEFLLDKKVIKTYTKFTLFGHLCMFLVMNLIFAVVLIAYIQMLIFDKYSTFDSLKLCFKSEMEAYTNVLKNKYAYAYVYDSSWRYYHIVLEENDLVEYLI